MTAAPFRVPAGRFVLVAGTGIALATSEGISIRATCPATGTWAAAFLVKWSEVTLF